MWDVTTSSEKRNSIEIIPKLLQKLPVKTKWENKKGKEQIGNFVSIKLFARGWVLARADHPLHQGMHAHPFVFLDFLARIGFTSHLWSDGRKHCPFHALWCPLSSVSRSALRPFDLWGRKIRSLSPSLYRFAFIISNLADRTIKDNAFYGIIPMFFLRSISRFFFRSLIVCRQRISIARIKALYGRIWNLYRVGKSTVSCRLCVHFMLLRTFNPSRIRHKSYRRYSL